MQNVHCIVMTRNDDLIIEHWVKKHINVFDKISVVDGSDGDFTQKVCEKYGILYTKDPEPTPEKPFHEQYLREAAFNLLKPYLTPGDWVGCFMPDEWVYHDPREIVDMVPGSFHNVISWNQLNILPHPSEKEEYLKSIEEGTYNPTEVFRHFWHRDNNKTCCEPRMFRYSGDEVWTHRIPWCDNAVAGRIQPINRDNIAKIKPTYFHYKVFDLDPTKYKDDGFGHFEKSNLNTGIGYGKGMSERKIHSIEDLFFYEDNIYCNLGTDDDGGDYLHGYCVKIGDDGIIPEENYNSVGNDDNIRLTV